MPESVSVLLIKLYHSNALLSMVIKYLYGPFLAQIYGVGVQHLSIVGQWHQEWHRIPLNDLDAESV